MICFKSFKTKMSPSKRLARIFAKLLITWRWHLALLLANGGHFFLFFRRTTMVKAAHEKQNKSNKLIMLDGFKIESEQKTQQRDNAVTNISSRRCTATTSQGPSKYVSETAYRHYSRHLKVDISTARCSSWSLCTRSFGFEQNKTPLRCQTWKLSAKRNISESFVLFQWRLQYRRWAKRCQSTSTRSSRIDGQ